VGSTTWKNAALADPKSAASASFRSWAIMRPARARSSASTTAIT
jgi:hypothetical protein